MKTKHTSARVATALMMGWLVLFSSSLFGQKIAGGNEHTLAICADSTARAWGYNNFGQLGDSGTTDQHFPVQVGGLTEVISIAGGFSHSLALRADGTVWVWGQNNSGQLGDGTTIGKRFPKQLNGFGGIDAISAGGEHSLLLGIDGKVWAWGANSYGQVGDGTFMYIRPPSLITGLTDISAISGGGAHSLALKANGMVWAWGHNYYGQLGDGTTTNKATPVQVSGLTGVTAIAGGLHHSLALKADGTVWAWGDNSYGQLGDGTTTQRNTPIQINGLAGAIAISAGSFHSLVLKADGTVWAWGYNNFGQLGDGTATSKYTPVQVNGLNGVTSIAAGWHHSLALTVAGTLWSWGRNAKGQLGDGATADRATPMPASGLCPITPLIPKKRNFITGICFIDYNQNNVQDGGEPDLPHVLVSSIGSSYTFSSITNGQGVFYNIVDLNSIITTPRTVPYFTFSPSQHISNFSSFYNTDSVNFAFVPVANIQDLRITLFPLSPARTGRNATYRMIYENAGTKIMSGSVFLKKDSRLSYVSANPAITSMNGDVLEWRYSNLTPNEQRSIDVTLSVSMSTSIGDLLISNARIEPIPTDTTPSDNTSNIEHSIIGSFDPNDKTMLQGDTLTTARIARGEYMTYLIRFQNTGNDTAFTVVVRDTLDGNLDRNTFQMVSASHNYTLAIRDNKNVAWTFDNILLPDSFVDEPGSHGYICYRIKPKSTLTAGDVIKNTAHIYFDYNVPVPTNTALTTVVQETGIVKEEIKEVGLLLYPNPAENKLIVRSSKLVENTVVEIYNLLGERVYEAVQGNNKGIASPSAQADASLAMTVDVSAWAKGVYFVMVSDGAQVLTGKVVVE